MSERLVCSIVLPVGIEYLGAISGAVERVAKKRGAKMFIRQPRLTLDFMAVDWDFKKDVAKP